MLGIIPMGQIFNMSSALCISVYIHYLRVAAAELYSLPALTSVGLSVGLHRNYKLPYQRGYISATGGRQEFADSEFEVGWGESREMGE